LLFTSIPRPLAVSDMKVLYVADLHYTLKHYDWLLTQAPDYAAIIIGGDLLDLASALDLGVQIVVVEKYLARLQQKTRVIVCSGNHDGDSRNEADESVARWVQESRSEGLHVDGEHWQSDGLLITICPWWDGPTSRSALEAQFEKDAQRHRRQWIWIHHAPPSNSPVCWTGRRYVGDEFLRGWIERFKPDLVFSGHIHNAPFIPPGSWVDQIGNTWVFNPGKQIGPRPTSIEVNLESMTAEWTSFEGRSLRQLVAGNG